MLFQRIFIATALVAGARVDIALRPMDSGTRLGPYEILEQVGAGGMGEVWLAQDTRLGRKVANKVLPAEFAADPDRLARFEQEARAAAALNHPHIGPIELSELATCTVSRWRRCPPVRPMPSVSPASVAALSAPLSPRRQR